MASTVQKWGNSLALRLPKAVAKDVRLQQGSQVDVTVVEGKIVVNPKSGRRPDLAEMLKNVSKKNMPGEQDWGKPVGREVW